MSMPETLRGYVDDSAVLTLDGFTTAVDYILENVPQLLHPQSVMVYANMRHDPMIAGILQAYSGPINRAPWSLDPAGCRDEVVLKIADDLGLPVKGWSDEADENEPDKKVQAPTGARRRRFTWDAHLRLAGRYRTFGHMFFEQAWAQRPDDAGRWSLDIVQERMPQTIAALKLNGDGTLNAVAQGSIVGKDTILLTTADHRLVHYSREREGSNYFGESMLRPCYAPWLIKTQVMRVWPTSNRRNGMGVWQAKALPGTNPTLQQMAEAQRVASGIRASENVGVAWPPGFTGELTGMSGTLPNHAELAQWCDQQMARATMTLLLTMAGAERGNRSLGETVMDLLIMAQQADAEFLAAEGTRQLVVPLVDANYGENEPAPRITVGDVGADVETTAQDIYWLTAYAGIKPDRPFREWARQQRGMPPEDPDDPIYTVQAPPPRPDSAPVPDPSAPPGSDPPAPDPNTDPPGGK